MKPMISSYKIILLIGAIGLTASGAKIYYIKTNKEEHQQTWSAHDVSERWWKERCQMYSDPTYCQKLQAQSNKVQQWTYGRTTNDYICFSQPYPYADKEPIPTTSHPDLLDCSQFIMGCSGDDTHCIGGPGGIAKTWKKHQGSCTIDFPICPGDDEHGEPK